MVEETAVLRWHFRIFRSDAKPYFVEGGPVGGKSYNASPHHLVEDGFTDSAQSPGWAGRAPKRERGPETGKQKIGGRLGLVGVVF